MDEPIYIKVDYYDRDIIRENLITLSQCLRGK